MLETAERFTPVEKEPAIRQFLLLIGGLRALGDADAPDDLAAAMTRRQRWPRQSDGLRQHGQPTRPATRRRRRHR